MGPSSFDLRLVLLSIFGLLQPKQKKQQKCGATDRIPFFVAELYGISIRFAIVTHELGLSIRIYKYFLDHAGLIVKLFDKFQFVVNCAG